MRILRYCPFDCRTLLWQQADGRFVLTVCVKGTYRFAPGRETELVAFEGPGNPGAPTPQAPTDSDPPCPTDKRNGLADPLTPSELVPYKAKVDVILVGSAFAPKNEPIDALVVRLCIGRLDKSVGVIGDRVWVSGPYGLEPGAPKPFASLPLAPELAPRTPENPDRFDITRPAEKGALALPNLEAVDDEAPEIQHAVFGPLSLAARSRRSRVTAKGLEWVQNYAAQPMPEGFDYAFFNVAPQDQQIDELGAEATLALENLSPTYPRLETHLPSMHPAAFVVSSKGGSTALVPLACDTVWIDTDRERVTLTWRGFFAVPTPEIESLGTLVVVASSVDGPPRAHDIELLVRAMSADPTGRRADAGSDDSAARATSVPRSVAPRRSSSQVVDDVSTIEVDTVTVPGAFAASVDADAAVQPPGSAEGKPGGQRTPEVSDDPSTLVKDGRGGGGPSPGVRS